MLVLRIKTLKARILEDETKKRSQCYPAASAPDTPFTTVADYTPCPKNVHLFIF